MDCGNRSHFMEPNTETPSAPVADQKTIITVDAATREWTLARSGELLHRGPAQELSQIRVRLWDGNELRVNEWGVPYATRWLPEDTQEAEE